MTVTQFSKMLGEPDWAQWPSELPEAIFGFRMGRLDFGTPLQAGEKFHSTFSRYILGKNIAPAYNAPCVAIENALADFGVVEVDSEVPVRGSGLSGQVDIVGRNNSGQPVLAELKSTLGPYALKPRPCEVIQLGTYAYLQGSINPQLFWIRVGLRSSCVSIFLMHDAKKLVKAVAQSMPAVLAA